MIRSGVKKIKKIKKIGLYFSVWTEEQLEKIRAAAPNFELLDLSGNCFDENIAECEILFGFIGSDILKAAKNLKWFHSQAAGVDSYLKPGSGLCESVVLTNSSGAYGIGISEHLITVTLMLLRKMNEYCLLQAQNKWQGLGTVKTLYDSGVTVVGLGDIGGNYAMRCHALGAKVRGVVRGEREKKPYYIDELFTGDKLGEALCNADIVALCLPETPKTRNILSGERMRALKKGALILNIGRGSAIDQEALIGLLESGHIGGAGLDVTTPEPLPKDSKLWNMPNVIITPHISGGMSLGLTLDLIVGKFIKYLGDYTAGREFARVVDRDVGY
jgi:phosphoglycerate dehydrogenase-like enzyme